MSETLYTLSEDALRRIVRQTLKEERTALDAAGLQRSRGMVYAKPQDGVLFRNESQETVPPHGVMEITDYDNANELWVIGKPTTQRNGQLWLVNRGAEVASGQVSRGDFGVDRPVKVLSYGTYGADQPMAPKPGYWHLHDGPDVFVENVGFYPYAGSYSSPTSPQYDPGSDLADPQYRMFYQFSETVDSSFTNSRGFAPYDESGTSLLTLDTATGATRYGYISLTTNEYSLGFTESGAYVNRRVGVEIPFGGTAPYTEGTIEFVRSGFYEINLRLAGFIDITGTESDYSGTYTTTSASGHTHDVTIPGVANQGNAVKVEVFYRVASSSANFGSSPGSYKKAFSEHWTRPPTNNADFTRFVTFYTEADEGDKLWLVVKFSDGMQNHRLKLNTGDGSLTSEFNIERIRNLPYCG